MENNHHEPSAVRPEEEEVILPTEEPMTETPSVQEEETAAVSDETNETNQANETDETNETDENAAVPIEKIFEEPTKEKTAAWSEDEMLWGSDKEEAEWASVKSSQEQPVTGRYVIPKSARRQKEKAADKPKKRPSAAEASAEEQPRRPKNYNDYKRSTIRQFSSLISLLIMVPVFALLVLFNWFFPRSEESMIEKRKLASFPEFTAENYFSGQFTAGINHWFTDTVPYRDNFKNAGNGFKGLFGITTDDSVNFVGDVKKVPKKTPKKDTSSAPSQSSAPVQTSQTSKPETSKTESSKPAESSSRNYREEDAEYKIENGVIVVNQDGHYRGLEMFGGGSGNAYVDALNEIRDKLDDNIRIYSMIAPLASEYYTPANCEEYTVNQKEYFDDIASRLKEGITSVDIESVLAQHTQEPIYCRTDHHWMPLGAYYAAQTFAHAAGVDFKALNTFKPVKIEGFVGTMYAFSGGDINIKNDPEDFIYYVPDNYDQCGTDYYDTYFNYSGSGVYFQGVGDPQTNAYLTFFGGDEQIVKVRTNVKNGRKLIVIKDSYGNAIPGHLMNSFEEIYIVDMRYFNLNLVDFIQQLNITDVLFAMCTFSAFGDNSYNLPTLIEQNPGITIVDDYLKTTGDNSEDNTDENSEDNTDENSEDNTDENSEDNTDESSEDNTDENSEDNTDENSEDNTDENSEDNTDENSEDNTDENSEDNTDENSEDNTDENSNNNGEE